jgi:hypothetical protein
VPRIAFTATISLWLLHSLGACTTTNVAEPADATTPGGAEQHADVVDDGEAPRPTVPMGSDAGTTTTGTTTGIAPTTSKPTQSYNCQAPLVVIEEVTRLLTVAGTHATRSAACVDGPGQRVTLDEILVCPLGRDGARKSFGVTYRVTTWDEGGRQVCAGKCPPVRPSTASIASTWPSSRARVAS